MTYNQKDVESEEAKIEAEGMTEEQQKERLDRVEDIIGESAENAQSDRDNA